jgi:hypothetical protein
MSLLVNYIYSWWATPELNDVKHSNKKQSIGLKSNIPQAPHLTSLTPVITNHSPQLLKEKNNSNSNVVYLVTANDLLAVKLKPVSNVIPAPARNMQNINKFQLHMLNQAQLQSILAVKLKPVNRCTKPKIYPPRHPVLQELLSRKNCK